MILEVFTEHNNSYLLAFVQLTRQVDSGWFLAVFYDFFDGIYMVGKRHSGKADQLALVSGGSEHA